MSGAWPRTYGTGRRRGSLESSFRLNLGCSGLQDTGPESWNSARTVDAGSLQVWVNILVLHEVTMGAGDDGNGASSKSEFGIVIVR